MIARFALWLYNQPYLLCTLTVLMWSGNATIARGIHDISSPVGLAFYRWLGALLVLAPLAYTFVRRDLQALARHWKVIAVLGFLGITCFQSLLYYAAQTTSALNIALFQTAMPAMIVLLSALLFRDTVKPVQAGAMALCFAGAMVIVGRGDVRVLLALDITVGDVVFLFDVFIYALYSVLLRLRPPVHTASLLVFIMALGVLFLIPPLVWEIQSGAFVMLNAELLPAVLYFALFPSILSYLFWIRGIELIGASAASLFINLLPVFTAGLAMVFLGERIALFHLAGLVLIASGISLFNLRALRRLRRP